MNVYPDGIYISESREDIKKIKGELAKKEKKFHTMNSVGSILTTIGSPALVGSLVSPFDIEGPLIEIISGVVLVVGTIMKKISADELEKLEAIKTNGQYSYKGITSNVDKEDIEKIKDTFNQIKISADQKRQNNQGFGR